MSYFKCPKCCEPYYIFGKGGAQRTANEMSMEFLGEVMLANFIFDPVFCFSYTKSNTVCMLNRSLCFVCMYVYISRWFTEFIILGTVGDGDQKRFR